ncbi:MAG: DUF86 domain-containing protein [Candidatus Atribacteria bacterium]|nr:DUF86 domain-containing protein [Candidatus Atribacteria bacterium]
MRDFTLFLEEIVEAMPEIEEFTEGMKLSEFIHDRKTQKAVIADYEIIGEAAKNIPEEQISN